MLSQGYSGYLADLGGHFCMNQLYYTCEVESPEVLEPFVTVQPQIEPMNSMRMLNLKDAVNKQAAQSLDGVRYVVTLSTLHFLTLSKMRMYEYSGQD